MFQFRAHSTQGLEIAFSLTLVPSSGSGNDYTDKVVFLAVKDTELCHLHRLPHPEQPNTMSFRHLLLRDLVGVLQRTAQQHSRQLLPDNCFPISFWSALFMASMTGLLRRAATRARVA